MQFISARFIYCSTWAYRSFQPSEILTMEWIMYVYNLLNIKIYFWYGRTFTAPVAHCLKVLVLDCPYRFIWEDVEVEKMDSEVIHNILFFYFFYFTWLAVFLILQREMKTLVKLFEKFTFVIIHFFVKISGLFKSVKIFQLSILRMF